MCYVLESVRATVHLLGIHEGTAPVFVLAKRHRISGRSCDLADSTEVFLVFFHLQANADMVPSCYCVLLMQPSAFKSI
jgi:hypothetical protein